MWKVLCVVLTAMICVALSVLIQLNQSAPTENAGQEQVDGPTKQEMLITPMPTDTQELRVLSNPSAEADYSDIHLAENVTVTLNDTPECSCFSGKSYEVDYKPLDTSALRALFGFEGVQGEAYGDCVSYISGEKKLEIVGRRAEKALFTTPAYEKLTMFFSFDNELTDNTNYFDWTQELSFLPREAALRQAIETANMIGIEVTKDARVIALSEVSLNFAEQHLEASQLFKLEGGKKRTWSAKDECYIVVLREAVDGFSVFPSFFRKSGVISPRFSCQMIVVIGREGIIGMQVSGFYTVKKEGELKSLIGFDEALDCLRNHFAASPSRAPLLFEHAELALIAQEKGKRIALEPMWIFLSEAAMGDNDPETGEFVYLALNGTQNRTFDDVIALTPVVVDAITGEVIEGYQMF